MEQRKLLIVGAGIGQLNIAKLAKEMNLYVVCVTSKGDWPVIPIADETWYIDIYDKETILKKAIEESIDAVITDQNDLTLPTVAYISENMNIPGNTYQQVESYCNKGIFRDNCKKLGIPVPVYKKIKNNEYKGFDVKLPWIVKPTDSQSSIGVKKIEKQEEIEAALDGAIKASHSNEAILEEFFVGKEIVCEGFINDGKYYNLGFADRKYFDLKDLMIPTQTLFPSYVSKEIQETIIEYEQKMAQYVNPNFGIVHSEYLYDEETGEIRVVESALRGGGVFISSHLIPYATSIDVNDILIRKALGEHVDVDEIVKNKTEKAAGYVCFYLKDGKIESVEGLDELKSQSFVKMIDLSKVKIGKVAERMTYKGARQGPILVTGDNRIELDKNIEYVQETLKININHNEKIIDGTVWN